MYFSDGFPILVTGSGVPASRSSMRGRSPPLASSVILDQYQPLFEALGEFELIYLSDTESSSARATATFNRFLPADRLRGVTSATPLGVEHFLEYLAASQRYEAKGSVTSARDLEVLREGEHLYTSLEHRALQAAWNNQSTSADRIRQRFLQKSLRATFTAVVLPYSYPIYSLRTEGLVSRMATGHPSGHASGHTLRRLNDANTTSYTDRWGQGGVCAGGGSDPGAAHLPRRLRRAGRSRPRHTRYPAHIWHRYRTHLSRIQTGSVQHPSLIS